MDKALDSSSIIDLQAPTALSSEFIGRLEHSPRGDHRVIAPILTIEQENAQPPPPVAPGSQSGGDPGTSTRGPRGSAGQDVIPDPPVPPPAIATGDFGDDGPPGFEGSSSASVPASHAPAAQRLGERVIRRLKKGKATNLAAKPRPVKPARAARARAIHSHTPHGSSRKANDNGNGSGEPQPYPRSSREQPPGSRVRGSEASL